MLSRLLCVAFVGCLCFLPGCGGGDAEFDPSEVEAQTEQEIQEAEDYEKQWREQTEGA